jgi:hypothetical protein
LLHVAAWRALNVRRVRCISVCVSEAQVHGFWRHLMLEVLVASYRVFQFPLTLRTLSEHGGVFRRHMQTVWRDLGLVHPVAHVL